MGPGPSAQRLSTPKLTIPNLLALLSCNDLIFCRIWTERAPEEWVALGEGVKTDMFPGVTENLKRKRVNCPLLLYRLL
jgi:hypothetical protein